MSECDCEPEDRWWIFWSILVLCLLANGWVDAHYDMTVELAKLEYKEGKTH